MEFFVEICPILANIFSKFQLQDFFCDYIHGLHLCDNFGVFNINIEDFIGKNSEKITIYNICKNERKRRDGQDFHKNGKISKIIQNLKMCCTYF